MKAKTRQKRRTTTLGLFRRDLVVSVRPIYAAKIIDGSKTVELRRRFPDSVAAGSLALIYSSSPVQAIIGYARIKEVRRLPVRQIWQHFREAACIEKVDFEQYFAGLKQGYAILLEKPRRARKQVKATDLQQEFGFTPPQSFRYVGEEYEAILRDERLQIPNRY